MAFLHGKGTRLLYSKYDLSAYFTNAESDATAASHDTTTFGKSTTQRSAGLFDGKLSLSGLYDLTAHGYVEPFLGSTAGEVITLIPAGDSALGDAAIIGVTSLTSYKTSSPVGGMVATSLSLECKTDYEPGAVVLHKLEAETSTGGETSVDNAVASTNGGFATIHCTAFTGTSLDVKLQHSSNNTDWVDLSPAFTQLTAAGSEAITIAAATTINRYVRVYFTIVGTTMTFLVAFARR